MQKRNTSGRVAPSFGFTRQRERDDGESDADAPA
jgi:hypothetical protein